jgi:hypothetical protein
MQARLKKSCTLGRKGEVVEVSASRFAQLERAGIAEALPKPRKARRVIEQPVASFEVSDPIPVVAVTPRRRRARHVESLEPTAAASGID